MAQVVKLLPEYGLGKYSTGPGCTKCNDSKVGEIYEGREGTFPPAPPLLLGLC